MGAADRTRTSHPTTTTHQRTDRRTVMRRNERRHIDQRPILRQHPRHRMNRRHLQRLPLRQRRKNPRKPLRQHRFPDPRRTRQHQMMRTRRSNLDRPPSIRLPDNLTQIPHRHHTSTLENIRNSKRQLPTQPPDHRGQIVSAQHLDPLHQARLSQRPSRNHHSPPPRPLRRKHRRQHTTHRPQTTVERQLPQKHSLPQQLPRQLLRRIEN